MSGNPADMVARLHARSSQAREFSIMEQLRSKYLANEIPVASAKPPRLPPTEPRPPKNEDDDNYGLED